MTESRERHPEGRPDLHKLGYAQELFHHGRIQQLAISFSIIDPDRRGHPLRRPAWAGTAAALIGWPVVTIFVLLIAA
jgi:hypothetical protein